MGKLKITIEIIGAVLLAISLIDYSRARAVYQNTAFVGVLFAALILVVGVLL